MRVLDGSTVDESSAQWPPCGNEYSLCLLTLAGGPRAMLEKGSSIIEAGLCVIRFVSDMDLILMNLLV